LLKAGLSTIALGDIASAANHQGTVDLVGLGIDLPADLTLETLAVLASAKLIFCLEPESMYHDVFEHFGLQAQSIAQVFDQYPDREQALQKAAEIVAEAAEAQPGVVFALGGHPTTAVLPILFLRSRARTHGLHLIVHPAISSLDTMFADLVFDPAEHGFQIIRGSDLEALAANRPAAILCPGYARTVLVSDRLIETTLLASRLMRTFGKYNQFFVYTHQRHRATISAVSVESIALLGLRPRLGDLLVIGPLRLLPPEIAALAEQSGSTCTDY
jgi:hypothetical protein